MDASPAGTWSFFKLMVTGVCASTELYAPGISNFPVVHLRIP